MSPNLVADAATLFRSLAEFVSESETSGRPLYAAQAKVMLKSRFPDFNEEDYGFQKFVEFINEGARLGYFAIERTEAGHPVLTPPGQEPAAADPPIRIRPDLWNAVVNWENGKRMWDTRRSRAYFLPTDEAGDPIWTSSPEDFVGIAPVSFDQQRLWMAAFAEQQEAPVRGRLQHSLDESTPGSFKRALFAANLQKAWTEYLQEHVVAHTRAWASENGIQIDTIIDKRKTHQDRLETRPTTLEISSGDSYQRSSERTPQDLLRTRLHRVIDQMSLSELSALQIPAQYLIEA